MNFNTVYNRSFQKLAERYNTQSTNEAPMNKYAMDKKANVLLGVLALALGAGINAGRGNTKKASYNQYKKVAATQAAFAPIKGLPDALKPVPTPMKIDNPQQAVGNAQMNQAAAAEGVGADTPQQPISDQDIAAKAIETVDKGNQALLKYLTQSKKNDQAVQQAYQQPANPVV